MAPLCALLTVTPHCLALALRTVTPHCLALALLTVTPHCLALTLQDGTISYEIKLTGELSTNMLSPGEEMPEHGTLVGEGVNAQHHQHMFCARLDLAVDDPQGGKGLVVTEVRCCAWGRAELKCKLVAVMDGPSGVSPAGTVRCGCACICGPLLHLVHAFTGRGGLEIVWHGSGLPIR